MPLPKVIWDSVVKSMAARCHGGSRLHFADVLHAKDSHIPPPARDATKDTLRNMLSPFQGRPKEE